MQENSVVYVASWLTVVVESFVGLSMSMLGFVIGKR